MGDEWILAIDFGSSNTAAAHTSPRDPHFVEALPLTHAGNLLPSAVFVEPDGRVVSGASAANRADADPAGLVAFPKRVIPLGGLHVRGVPVPAAELVAPVLRAAYATGARRHGGTAPDAVVLTHPEAWGDRELFVLRDAARRAGIDPPTALLFVSEPRAAATYYTASDRYAAGERLGVFDFGGGTLDVAILEAGAAGRAGEAGHSGNAGKGAATSDFRVLAARGDNGLGGRNLDALLRGWVFDELDDFDPRLAEELRSGASPATLRALDASVRAAKEVLSEGSSASIMVSAPGGHRSLLVTRAEFDARIAPEVDRALGLTRAAMDDAGVSRDSLRSIYLTGGSSQVPLVHERMAEIAPVAVLDDPKTVVAQGALIGALRVRPRGSAAQAPDGMSQGQRQPAPNARKTRNDDAEGSRKKATLGRRVALAAGGVVILAAALAGGAYAAKIGPFAKDDGPMTPPATPQEFVAAQPAPMSERSKCESKSVNSASGTQLDGVTCTFDADGMGIGDRTSLTYTMYAEGTSVAQLDAELGGKVVNPRPDRPAVSRLDSDSGDWTGYQEVGDGYVSVTALHPRSQTVITDVFPGSEEAAATFWEKAGFKSA